MNDAWNFLVAHPLYIPFLILNIYIIYRVFYLVLTDHHDPKDHGDDSDDDPEPPTEPDLDLPPGVTLSTHPELEKETA
jgi:hypothetical protein